MELPELPKLTANAGLVKARGFMPFSVREDPNAIMFAESL